MSDTENTPDTPDLLAKVEARKEAKQQWKDAKKALKEQYNAANESLQSNLDALADVYDEEHKKIRTEQDELGTVYNKEVARVEQEYNAAIGKDPTNHPDFDHYDDYGNPVTRYGNRIYVK